MLPQTVSAVRNEIRIQNDPFFLKSGLITNQLLPKDPGVLKILQQAKVTYVLP